MKKLAIIDWGIGGIGIFKLVKQEIGVPVVYFSDTGATPYGKMTRSELVTRLNLVVTSLKDRGVTHLVIGCNAASTAIPFLTDRSVAIEGMIDHAVAASIEHRPRQLAVIGGRRTVLSGVYRKQFAAYGLSIEQRIAQPLSGLIESGDVSSEKLRSEAKKILRPVRNSTHILLACTHYPAITSVLRHLVSGETKFIDPAGSMVKRISKWKIESAGTDEFLTSGDPRAMERAARLAFGVEIETISKTIF